MVIFRDVVLTRTSTRVGKRDRFVALIFHIEISTFPPLSAAEDMVKVARCIWRYIVRRAEQAGLRSLKTTKRETVVARALATLRSRTKSGDIIGFSTK